MHWMSLTADNKKKVLLISFGFLVLLWICHGLWLPIFGDFLVVEDHLEKSDAIIVLGTDPEGAREDWAARIYKEGYAKTIIMCGYQTGWKSSTAEIMKRHAVHLGVPDDAIILDYGWDNHGTWDNAINSLKIVKEHNFRSAIVVTSNYHTRRSRLAFDKVFKGTNVKIVISPCPGGSFAPGEWWKNRELVKTAFLEYTKLIYYFVFSPDLAQCAKE